MGLTDVRKRAFTLIELLVVVAIIGILSGLLFPVLRQAQLASLRVRCISNFRQAQFALSLYSGDNDSRFALAASNPNQDATAANNRRWPQLIMPYTRDVRTFRCPRDPYPAELPNASWDADIMNLNPSEYEYRLAERTNIGYNYMYLSPIVRSSANGKFFSLSRADSEVYSTSLTLLAVDSVWHVDESGHTSGGGSYLVVPPCRYSQTASGVSDSMRLPPGTEVYLQKPGWVLEDRSVIEYGGAWPWHDQQMTVMFLDGHAASFSTAKLSKGCDVSNNLGGDIIDASNYAWDLD